MCISLSCPSCSCTGRQYPFIRGLSPWLSWPLRLCRRALTMLSPNLLLKGLPPSLSPSQPIGPPPLMLGPQHRALVTALPCFGPAYTRYWVLPALGPLHLLNSVLGIHVIKLPLGLGPLSVCRDTEERVVGWSVTGPQVLAWQTANCHAPSLGLTAHLKNERGWTRCFEGPRTPWQAGVQSQRIGGGRKVPSGALRPGLFHRLID